MTEQILPCNIKSSEADLTRAKLILKTDENYIVRYLRHAPTVGLAKLPTRNADGGIIEDADWKRKRVICSGVPFACMIGFMHQDVLLIGWSKRIGDRRLVETRDLHSLFRDILDSSVPEDEKGYQDAFNAFSNRLVRFMSGTTPKDIEISFSKKVGKTAAVVRGLNDSISVNGKYLESGASGTIPGDIAKNLLWFISHVEQAYGGKAANVGYPDLIPVAQKASALAIV